MASQISSSAAVVLLILCQTAYVNSASWANGWEGSSAAGWSSSPKGSFGGSSGSGWGVRILRKQTHHRGNQPGSSLNRDTDMDTTSPLKFAHFDENIQRKITRGGTDYVLSSQATGSRISSAEEHSISIPADNAGKYGASPETENYPADDESIESQSVWETRGS
ncbi:unnamed protein product, partial [Anisakis simplex]|uniref:Secreted protein n=1 Tax=Anisakis simplex TaxID=6269 RepID=A0A0M3J879_ANISI